MISKAFGKWVTEISIWSPLCAYPRRRESFQTNVFVCVVNQDDVPSDHSPWTYIRLMPPRHWIAKNIFDSTKEKTSGLRSRKICANRSSFMKTSAKFFDFRAAWFTKRLLISRSAFESVAVGVEQPQSNNEKENSGFSWKTSASSLHGPPSRFASDVFDGFSVSSTDCVCS